MTFQERVEGLAEEWALSFVAINEGTPANEACAVAVFATAELFRRLITANDLEKWGAIEKEISRQFAEALHKGVEASRSPFN